MTGENLVIDGGVKVVNSHTASLHAPGASTPGKGS
jgi:hypothetical protein